MIFNNYCKYRYFYNTICLAWFIYFYHYLRKPNVLNKLIPSIRNIVQI